MILDLFEYADSRKGETLRDEGIARVSGRNTAWLDNALALIASEVAPGTELMGEDLRAIPGIGEPTHPNAFGALVRTAIRRGLIEPTGQFRKAKRETIHAHRLAVYRRTRATL